MRPRLCLLALLGPALTVPLAQPADAAGPVLCQGLVATIVGDSSEVVFNGTSRR